ncbi:hypothetical protein LCGC14_1826320 [marine sediment metagenome]|uniref:Uncharacterized protein n=1 Tax=marine sediment metagenome TaxID=412755 RepID=A0A0F9IX51_9ZZZZ
MEEQTCNRKASSYLNWVGQKPLPMCEYHVQGPMALASHMGWGGISNHICTDEKAKCESKDPHPDDGENKER